VWDGLGAVLKRCVLGAITNGKALTTSGKITTDLEAREHLQNHFTSEAWTTSHESKVVSKINIVHSTRETIELERQAGAASKFSGAEGISGTYEFLALTRTLIAARTFGCWCIDCWRAVRDGGGSSTPAAGCGREMCGWVEQKLHLTNTRAVQQTRASAQAAGKRRAQKLRPGDWVVAQAREGGRGSVLDWAGCRRRQRLVHHQGVHGRRRHARGDHLLQGRHRARGQVVRPPPVRPRGHALR
jgi:hypothetical protein